MTQKSALRCVCARSRCLLLTTSRVVARSGEGAPRSVHWSVESLRTSKLLPCTSLFAIQRKKALVRLFSPTSHNLLDIMNTMSQSQPVTMMRQQLQNIRSDRFLLAWNLTSLATFLLPLIFFVIARVRSDGDEEENQEDQYDEYGNYVGQNHWWQFWRRNNNYDQNDQQDDDQDEGGAPWWCK